jgi:hypothetical protein
MKKHIEAEKGELIIVSDEGHRAIIPAKDRKYFLDSLNGCDDCINKYIQQLPMMSNYAEDGSLVPDDGDPIKKETYEQWGDRIRKMSPNLDYTKDGDYNYRGAYEAGLEPIEVDNNGVKEYHLGSRNPKTGEILKYRSHPTFNQAISEDVKMGYVPYEKDGRIYTVDRKSKEYKDLYDSGKLLGYDRGNDLYIAPDLGGATIKATKPQWMKDKEALEKEYSKDWYIDNNLPKFSRSMGVSPNNMGGNQKGYDEYINNKLAESILKRNPNFDKDYSNNRLKTLSNYSQKELEIIKNSNLSYKVEPSIWSKFEQGLLSVGNAGSPVTFKNENLTQKEAKKEDNPLNILQPLSVPSKMVQSVYKKDYSFKDALQGKQNNAGIGEDILTDPLNLVGLGIWSKLSKANKVIDAAKAGSKVLNKIDDVIPKKQWYDNFHLGELSNELPINYKGDFIERGVAKESALNDFFNTGIIRNNKSAGLPLNKRSSNYGERVFFGPSSEPSILPRNNYTFKVRYSDELKNRPVTFNDVEDIIIKNADGTYSPMPNWKDKFKNHPNKTDDVVKAGFLNPLTLLTKPKTLIDNVLGRNQLEKNTSNLYRKIGNKKGLESLIENEGAISPGYNNVWFSKGSPNEDYNGVFAVELSSDKIGIGKNEISKGKGLQTGYKVTNKNNIPLEDLKVYRRRFLSTAYKEIDKTKLANELKTANIQNYIEKLWKYGSQGYLLHEFLAHEFPEDFDKWTPNVEKFYKEKVKPASKSLDEYMWNLITNQNKSEQ